MHFIKAIALNGLLLAVIGHGLTGVSLVWDKVLLKRRGMQNLLSYVFWLGAISVFGLVLIAFGFHWPGWKLAGIGTAAGLCDLIATYFYYFALKAGEASEELAAMGGFTPVATFLIAMPLLNSHLHGDFLGFLLMTIGGFVMFVSEKPRWKQMAPPIAAAAGFFGLTNVLQKIAFNGAQFVSGYVFFTVGTTIGAFLLLVPPSWRRQVFEHSKDAPPRSRAGYFANRFVAGVASFLIVYAVSKADPSIVQAIAGVRYVVIFVGAYLITRLRPSWFRENFGSRALIFKTVGTALVVAGLVMLGLHGGGGSAGPS